MVSNDIVMPLVLQRREAIAVAAASDVGALLLTVRRIAIFVILLLAYMYYRSAGEAQLASIGLLSFAAIAQLAPAFFGGLIWRRGTARGAHRRHDRRHPGVGLYAAAAELRRRRHRRHSTSSTDGPFGIALLRPQASVRARPAAAGARRAAGASPLNVARLCRRSRSRARRPRSSGCRPTCSCRPTLAPIDAELPAVALLGHGRGADRDGRALSRRGAHAQLASRASPRRRRISLDPQAGGRLPAAALCRAPARLGDRRGVLAARALAAAAQAHGLDQGRAQAARRRQRRDPLQPRNPADRARPCAPGHRGVRQGPAAGLLEPAVRRNPRPAAGAHPRRHRARRDPAPQRRAAARSGPARVDDLVRERIARYVSGSEPFLRALRRARPGDRGARQPHAGRRPRHHLHRHHAERRRRPRRWSAPTRRSSGACGSAPRS